MFPRSTLPQLIVAAPWREDMAYRDTWPQEYAVRDKDDVGRQLKDIAAR